MPIRSRVRRLRITGWTSQIVLLASWAVLMALAQPWPSIWPLAHLGLVPLALLGLRGQPLRRVAWLTYLVAAVWWLYIFNWITYVTIPGYIVLCLYLALYPTAFVLILRPVHRRLGLPAVIDVPLVWVGLEYMRGIMLTGLPWTLIGHSQPAVMIQTADFAGAYGVSFVVAMTSGLIVDLLTRPLFRRAGFRPRRMRSFRFGLTLWLIAVVGSLAYGMYRLRQTEAVHEAAASLPVAVIQTNVPQSNKNRPTFELEQAWFNEAIEMSRQAADQDARLIVWPETMVPGSLNEQSMAVARWAARELDTDDPDAPMSADRRAGLRRIAHYAVNRRAIEQLAERHRTAVVVGAHAVENWATDDVRRFNTAYLFAPGGVLRQRYDKVHRVPFGEYIPWVSEWPWAKRLLLTLTPYDTSYDLTAGAMFRAFTIHVEQGGDWRLAVPICFEDLVSYVPRQMVWGEGKVRAGFLANLGRLLSAENWRAGKRVDVLLNLTNDGWYAGEAEGPQHEQAARFRCVENRVPMARAVNTGISGFIDSAGRVVERVVVDGRSQAVAGIATRALHRDPRVTVFARIGDLWGAGCAVISAVLLGIAAFRRSPGRKEPA